MAEDGAVPAAEERAWLVSARGEAALNRQIARDMARRIHSGELNPGDELPTEGHMAASYGVNRLTVRHAVHALVQQGLLHTARGRRTVVTTPPVRYRLDDDPGTSLATAMTAQGLTVTHAISEVAPVEAADAPCFLDGSGRCARYGYRRRVDGIPWSVSCTWLPAELAPTDWDGSRPLLDAVASEHDLRIRRARRSFTAVPATFDDAEQLDVSVGAPLLLVTGTSVDQYHRTVAVVRHRTRGDRAEYSVALTADAEEDP